MECGIIVILDLLFLPVVFAGLTFLNFFFAQPVLPLHNTDPPLILLHDLIVLLQPLAILLLLLQPLPVVLLNSLFGLFLVLQLEGHLLTGQVLRHLLDLKLEVGLQHLVFQLLLVALLAAAHSISVESNLYNSVEAKCINKQANHCVILEVYFCNQVGCYTRCSGD